MGLSRIILNVLRSVFQHLDQKGVKLVHMDDEDLFLAVNPYAQELGRYFGSLSVEERKRFRDLRGVQGQTTRTRRCQQAIRSHKPDFNPVGLDEFINLEKLQTNLRAKEIIDRIEKTLQATILEEIKEEYGSDESEWWLLGVPKKVRLEVTQRFENDDGKRGSKEAYFELIDYRRIALEQWTLLGAAFGDGKSGNKEVRTKWMVTVNERRNVVSHVSSGINLTMEELSELEQIESRLLQRIADLEKSQATVESNESESSDERDE